MPLGVCGVVHVNSCVLHTISMHVHIPAMLNSLYSDLHPSIPTGDMQLYSDNGHKVQSGWASIYLLARRGHTWCADPAVP